MGKFIEDLYYGKIDGQIEDIFAKPGMIELYNKSVRIEQELLKNFTDEEKALFNKNREVLNEIDRKTQYYVFEKGFKLGLSLQNEL